MGVVAGERKIGRVCCLPRISSLDKQSANMGGGGGATGRGGS